MIGRRAARAAWVAAVIAGLVGIALVVIVARKRSATPIRCAPPMIALGPRCCGEGQTLGADLRCEGAATSCANPLEPSPNGCIVTERVVAIAGGDQYVGPGDWEAQGKVTPHLAHAAPFRIDAFEATEGAWSRCVDAAGCATLPLSGERARAIAGMTFDEARRFCAWKQGDLPSLDQMAFAAAGSQARRYPWGDTGAVCRRAAFSLKDGPCGEGARGPELVGSHPDGASPEGVFDLAGNVAEWTLPESANALTTKAFGGSWADGEAAALRTWNGRDVPVTTRSAAIGLRCVYPATAP